MKKIKNLLLLVFITKIAWTQTLCVTAKAGDNPPGCVHCSGIFHSSTENYTPETFSINFPCGKIENSQWISVRSNSKGELSLKIVIDFCDSGIGVEAVLYNKELQPVSNCLSVFTPRGVEQLNLTELNPGERYLLLIDGKDAAICSFSVEVLTIPGMDNPPGGEPFELLPDSKDVCGGAVQRFSISPVENADYYTWQLPQVGDVVAGGTIFDTYVDFRFSQFTSGARFVHVTPELSCFSGIPSFVDVQVHSINAFTRQTVFVCQHDLPKVIEGIWVDSIGRFADTIPNETTGCPERFFLDVQALPIQSVVLDTVICPGSCVIFNDSCYYVGSNETIFTPCEEITQLNIIHADTGQFEIQCFIDSFINALTFDWRDLKADSTDIFINDLYYATTSGSSFLLGSGIIPGDSVKFRVVPRNALGCTFKTSEITCSLPQTSDLSEKDLETEIKILPNPTSDFFEIRSSIPIDQLLLFDLSGKLQKVVFDEKTDVSHLSPGVYFLKIRIGKYLLIKKIVIF